MSTESEVVSSQEQPAAPADATPQPPAPVAAPPKKTKPRAQSTAKKTRSVELTLTVTGTADGEWQAELSQSGKRVLQGLTIPAAAVSRAAAELHEDISKTIETVLDAAREQHRTRVEELEAELNKVRQALAELQD